MATMTFEGPTTGRLTLAVPHDMCPELTANVLGLDPDDDAITESASQDALKELLNITCGHVLTTLAGEEPIFNLSVPEIAPLPNDGWNKLYREAGTCPLLVDDNPVLIHLQLDS